MYFWVKIKTPTPAYYNKHAIVLQQTENTDPMLTEKVTNPCMHNWQHWYLIEEGHCFWPYPAVLLWLGHPGKRLDGKLGQVSIGVPQCLLEANLIVQVASEAGAVEALHRLLHVQLFVDVLDHLQTLQPSTFVRNTIQTQSWDNRYG